MRPGLLAPTLAVLAFAAFMLSACGKSQDATSASPPPPADAPAAANNSAG